MIRARMAGTAVITASMVLATHAISQPSPIVIEAYGDSTTEGWTVEQGVGRRTPNSAIHYLQSNLDAQFGDRIKVINLGKGGTEAAQLLGHDSDSRLSWAIRMKQSPARIVLLNYGLNDAYYAQVHSAQAPVETPDDYAEILTQLVAIARQAGKIVILEEPNPTCNRVREGVLPAYVEKLRDVAARNHVALVSQYDYILALPDWRSLLSDCLHPTEALYRIKGQRVAATLVPIVRPWFN